MVGEFCTASPEKELSTPSKAEFRKSPNPNLGLLSSSKNAGLGRGRDAAGLVWVACEIKKLVAFGGAVSTAFVGATQLKLRKLKAAGNTQSWPPAKMRVIFC
jgi:hypothetical protein